MQENDSNIYPDQIIMNNCSTGLELIIITLIKCKFCGNISLPPLTDELEIDYFCKNCTDLVNGIYKEKIFSKSEMKMLEGFKIICRFNKYGCNLTFSYSDSLEKILLHQHQQCYYRPLKCKYCDFTAEAKNIPNHEMECDERTNICNNCKFLFKIKSEHKIGDCIRNLSDKIEELNSIKNNVLIFSKKIEELEILCNRKSLKKPKKKLRKKKTISLMTKKTQIHSDSCSNYKIESEIKVNFDEYQTIIDNGLKLLKSNNYDSARDYFEKTLVIFKNNYGENDLKVSNCYYKLALIYEDYYIICLNYSFEISIKILKENYGEVHSEIANIYSKLGDLYICLNKYEFSNFHYGNSLDLRKSLNGHNLAKELIPSFIEFGLLQNEIAKFSKALEFFNNALLINNNDESNIIGTSIYEYIGDTYFLQGNFLVATSNYEKALSLRKSLVGEDNLGIAILYSNLGFVNIEQKNYINAKEKLKKSLEIRLKSNDKKTISLSYHQMGYLYFQDSQLDLAIINFNESLKIRREIFGENNRETAKVYEFLGLIEEEKGNYKNSIKLLELCYNILSKIFDENHSEIANSLFNLGYVYFSMKKYPIALEYYEKALKIRKTLYDLHPEIADTYNNIGLCYDIEKDFKQSFQNFYKALKIRKTLLFPEHSDLAVSYSNTAMACIHLNKKYKTHNYLERALVIRKKEYGESSKQVAETYQNLGFFYSKSDIK